MANYSTLRQHYNVKCTPSCPPLLKHLLSSSGSTKLTIFLKKTPSIQWGHYVYMFVYLHTSAYMLFQNALLNIFFAILNILDNFQYKSCSSYGGSVGVFVA